MKLRRLLAAGLAAAMTLTSLGLPQPVYGNEVDVLQLEEEGLQQELVIDETEPVQEDEYLLTGEDSMDNALAEDESVQDSDDEIIINSEELSGEDEIVIEDAPVSENNSQIVSEDGIASENMNAPKVPVGSEGCVDENSIYFGPDENGKHLVARFTPLQHTNYSILVYRKNESGGDDELIAWYFDWFHLGEYFVRVNTLNEVNMDDMNYGSGEGIYYIRILAHWDENLQYYFNLYKSDPEKYDPARNPVYSDYIDYLSEKSETVKFNLPKKSLSDLIKNMRWDANENCVRWEYTFEGDPAVYFDGIEAWGSFLDNSYEMNVDMVNRTATFQNEYDYGNPDTLADFSVQFTLRTANVFEYGNATVYFTSYNELIPVITNDGGYTIFFTNNEKEYTNYKVELYRKKGDEEELLAEEISTVYSYSAGKIQGKYKCFQTYFDQNGIYFLNVRVGKDKAVYRSADFNYTVPAQKKKAPRDAKIENLDYYPYYRLTFASDEGNQYCIQIKKAGEKDNFATYETYNESLDLDSIMSTHGYGDYVFTIYAISDDITETAPSDVYTYSTTISFRVRNITLPERENVAIGKSKTLKPVFNDDSNVQPEDVKITWVSTDASIVAVNQQGVITGKNSGTAYVYALCDMGEDAPVESNLCEVTVSELAKSIKISPKLAMGKGESTQLAAYVEPAVASMESLESDTRIKFVSDNEDYVKIEDQYGGYVYLHATDTLPAGKTSVTATITARTTDGSNLSAKCLVTVGQLAEEIEIKAPADENELQTGKKLRLTATVLPAYAINRDVVWSTDDPALAVVDNKGNVTAKAPGMVYIYATNPLTGVSEGYGLSIYNPLKKIAPSATKITLHEGKSYELGAVITPVDASYGYEQLAIGNGITFEPADEASKRFITVNPDTGRITAKNLPEGLKKATAKVNITATSDGNITKTSSCSVTIVKNEVKISKIKLDKSKISMGVGAVTELAASPSPEWADDTEVKWEIDNADIAELAVNPGNKNSITIKAKNPGTATITAKSKDGSNKKATCKLTVGNAVDKIEITNAPKKLIVGKNLTLKTRVSAANGKAANPQITWSSSDEYTASVDSKGKVTAICEGSVTITATSEIYGTEPKSVSVDIETYVPVSKITINKSKLTVGEGHTGALWITTVKPDNPTDPTIKWTVTKGNDIIEPNCTETYSNYDMFTFEALKPGTAQITGMTCDGSNKKVTATVKVVGRMKGEDVKLNIKSVPKGVQVEENNTNEVTVKDIAVKKSFTLTPVLTKDAFDKSVSYMSSNPAIATVNDKGKVTVKSPGNAVITMTTADGGYKATCRITAIAIK